MALKQVSQSNSRRCGFAGLAPERLQDCEPYDFGENLTTTGIVIYELPIGARLSVGETLLEVTQIGKVCHDHCAIYYAAGDCVMPREGIFVRVLKGGLLRAGDTITLVET